jgi:hypothetical protein
MDIVERLRNPWRKPGHKPPEMDEAAAEIERLVVALETAMNTIDQIAPTPRNKGERRNASATAMFIRTQMDGHNVELTGAARLYRAASRERSERG